MRNQSLNCLYLIVIVLLTSCNNKDVSLSNPIITQYYQTPSASPTGLDNIDITPIIQTSVITPNLTPQTLLLNDQQKVETYILLFSSCSLPCWWNSIPGITTTGYLKSIYRSYGLPLPEEIIKSSEDTRIWQVSELSTSGNRLIQQFFFSGNNVLVRIKIKIDNPKRQNVSPDYEYRRITESININSILKKYGKPQNVYLFTSPAAPEGGNVIPYVLLLDFSAGNFNVLFSGINIIQGDSFRICPQQAYIEINTWDSLSGITSNMTLWPGAVNDLHPMAQVSDFDINKFFEVFSNASNTECITTKSNIW